MKNSDRSNLIIEEANGIINSFIKKKTSEKSNKNKALVLALLTMSLAILLFFIIRNI